MKYSQSFINTLRADPKDEVSTNAKLLLRGGFVDKLMAGSYSFLPLGWRVYQKIENIVREEMKAIGSEEILMPLLHPRDVWNETGRWNDPGVKEIMYQFKTTEGKEYGLSFTHEEIFLDIVRKYSLSYKNLPVRLYHFSTKFRNEFRAKSGLLRGREFLMKDLYSIHASQEDLDKFYGEVKAAYLKIYKKIGLNDTKVVEASGGVFTSGYTHEFQVPSAAGEDIIYVCAKCDWAQNKEIVSAPDQKKCPKCSAVTQEINSIEVGNIFRFGTSYSEKMKVNFKNNDGQVKAVFLGSYGIGMSRLVGTLAEKFNDDKGLIWPATVAPFMIHLVSIGNIAGKAEEIYRQVEGSNIDILWDDRSESAGVKLADADLIGIPLRMVISEKTLEQDSVEVKARNSTEVKMVKIADIPKLLAHADFK